MLEIRRGRDRGYGDHGWLKSFFTFSFADYYDPEQVDFGPVKVMNEDRVKPARGYPVQQLPDMEVLTYLIDGELEHKDSLGNSCLVQAGSLQRMTGGPGITYTDSNPSTTREAHFLNIWMKPDANGFAPGYELKHFPATERSGALRLIASPDGEAGSVVVHMDARLYTGLFHEAQRLELDLPKTRRLFVHVLSGSIAINETRLNAGDGVKITHPADVALQHGREADVIVFDVPAGPPPIRRKTPAPRVKKALKTTKPLESPKPAKKSKRSWKVG